MNRIEQLKEMLRESPNDNFLRHALALEYIKINEVDKAQKLWENLLRETPEYVGSYYHLGKLLEQKGETQNAIHWYEQGLQYARNANEHKAFRELQSALDELNY